MAFATSVVSRHSHSSYASSALLST